MKRSFLLVLVSMMLGCGGSEPTPPRGSPAGVPAVSAPVPLTEAPFTVDQLVQSFLVGTRMVYRSVPSDAPEQLLEWQVTAADAEGATLLITSRSAAGEVLGDAKITTIAYRELRSNSRFPEEHTSQGVEQIALPAGRFETVRYRVNIPVADGTMTNTYWFARALPGPAVRMVTTRDGKPIYRLELQSWSPASMP